MANMSKRLCYGAQLFGQTINWMPQQMYFVDVNTIDKQMTLSKETMLNNYSL